MRAGNLNYEICVPKTVLIVVFRSFIYVSFHLERSAETIICGVTTVRLVSSGQFHNSVTVAVTPPDAEAEPTLVCEQQK